MQKYFYISSFNSISGISKYSRDFYDLVLKDKGYILLDSKDHLSEIMSAIGSRDFVHIEIGIFQKKEIEILFTMLDSGYRNISVTLHDPPLVRYPFHEFGNKFLNNVSKFYDKYIMGFKTVKGYLEKIKAIYVLSQKAVRMMETKYSLQNIYYLPHVINTSDIQKGNAANNNFIFFGFIGKNKGIEYSLQLHKLLQNTQPNINFYVVGKPLTGEKKFYKDLKERYKKNVHYMGYVPENELDELFASATFAMHMFRDYRFFWPVSGSVLYSLKKGKIVFANKVNALPELIKDKENGFFLSGNLKKDCKTISELIDSRSLLQEVNNHVYSMLLKNHSANTVKNSFIHHN